ncbi:MAG: chemotaxis protein CheX, partial [Chloroflexota bacterium]
MTASTIPWKRAGEAHLPRPLVDAARQATTATFGAIHGVAPTYLGEGQEGTPCDGVIGIISFVGDHLWSVMLGVPRQSAPGFALSFAGLEVEFDSADMGDVVGELTNVLAGDISARLDAVGIRAEMSLP